MDLNLRQHGTPACLRTPTVMANLIRLFCLGLLVTLSAAKGQAQSLMTLTASPIRIASGQRTVCTATLDSPAPYYKPGSGFPPIQPSVGTPTWILTASSNPALTRMFPAILAASFSTQVTFYVVTSPVSVETPVVLTATCHGVSRSLTVTLLPFVPPTLKVLSVSPTSVTGSKNTVGTVSVNNLIPVNTYITLTLTSSNPTVASVPASVRIDWLDDKTGISPNNTATFPITTAAVSQDTAVTLTAAFNGITKTATLMVLRRRAFDFDEDGHNDLLFQNRRTGQMVAWFMSGADVLGGSSFNAQPAIGWNAVGVADFNNDGHPDLVFQNAASGQIVFWYLNGTALTGGGPTSISPAPAYKLVATGDFNRDGNIDLVFQNQNTHQIAIWFMNGTQVLGGVTMPYVPAAGLNVVGAGDFNGDGHTDLLLQNAITGQVVVWLMRGSSYFDTVVLAANPTAAWKVKGVADYNGDGMPDIVFQNSVNNQILIWFMNGLTVASPTFTSALPDIGYQLIGPQ